MKVATRTTHVPLCARPGNLRLNRTPANKQFRGPWPVEVSPLRPLFRRGSDDHRSYQSYKVGQAVIVPLGVMTKSISQGEGRAAD